jgi:competence protein ComEA
VSVDGERLNINTASRTQLMRLPRIGAQAADRIIQFREREGRIRNIRQLRQADAIPVSAARQIRDLVRF